MKLSSVPTKFNIPFANGAGASYIRAIPQASQTGTSPGAASLTDGFPPATFVSTSGGGVPPSGQDFNGILKQITQWSQWASAGNAVQYDSAFATAIGGYPAGAVLSSTPAGVLWVSTVDDNLTNPNTGGAGWVQIPTAVSGYGVDTGVANALSVTLSNPPPALYDGMRIVFRAANTNTTSCTINWGGLGAVSLVAVGANLGAGVIVAGAIYEAIYVASLSAFALIGQTAGQVIVPNAVIPGAAVNLSQLDGQNSSNGYQNVPSGVTRRWISSTVVLGTAGSLNFSKPFPTSVFGANAMVSGATNDGHLMRITGVSLTGISYDWDAFNTNSGGQTRNVFVEAVGN